MNCEDPVLTLIYMQRLGQRQGNLSKITRNILLGEQYSKPCILPVSLTFHIINVLFNTLIQL